MQEVRGQILQLGMEMGVDPHHQEEDTAAGGGEGRQEEEAAGKKPGKKAGGKAESSAKGNRKVLQVCHLTAIFNADERHFNAE